MCARQPREHYTTYWMAFLTQAGVTLGLASNVSDKFAWGPDFSASIVSVVVINQMIGPVRASTPCPRQPPSEYSRPWRHGAN